MTPDNYISGPSMNNFDLRPGLFFKCFGQKSEKILEY